MATRAIVAVKLGKIQAHEDAPRVSFSAEMAEPSSERLKGLMCRTLAAMDGIRRTFVEGLHSDQPKGSFEAFLHAWTSSRRQPRR